MWWVVCGGIVVVMESCPKSKGKLNIIVVKKRHHCYYAYCLVLCYESHIDISVHIHLSQVKARQKNQPNKNHQVHTIPTQQMRGGMVAGRQQYVMSQMLVMKNEYIYMLYMQESVRGNIHACQQWGWW